MIPDDQMLFPLQCVQVFFRRFSVPEKEITDDIDGIVSVNTGIPVPDKRLIHFFSGAEGSGAVPDDILMSQMQVSRVVDQVFHPLTAADSSGFSLYPQTSLVKAKMRDKVVVSIYPYNSAQVNGVITLLSDNYQVQIRLCAGDRRSAT
jgi:hypothetical protein